MPWGLFWRKRSVTNSVDEDDEEMQTTQEASEEDSGEEGRRRAAYYAAKSGRRSTSEDAGRGETGFMHLLTNSKEFRAGDQTCSRLVKCIYLGNADALSECLSGMSKQEVETFEIGGQRLLHVLCFRKCLECLEVFLAFDVDPNAVNVDGISPLHLAVSEGWTEGLEALLSRGASANALPEAVSEGPSAWPFQELPIHTAIRNRYLEMADLLLDRNPNLGLTDADGNTILHLSCASHCLDLVKRLLEKQVVASAVVSLNKWGNSPLHCLMIGDHLEDLRAYEDDILECVHLLVAKGADVDQVNGLNKTPMYLAAKANLPTLVKTLLDAGSDPLIRTRNGRTVLHAACRFGSHESLSLLLDNNKASKLLLVEDKFGNAPFHVAVNSSCASCCEILLRNGDHLTRVDSKNRSRCALVLKNLPSAPALMKRALDANIEISDKDIDDADFQIKMDFSVLLSKCSENVESSLIADFNDCGRDTLLKHPLVEMFLYLKWHRIRCFFYFYVFLYFVFLILHTFYIVKTYANDSTWENEENILKMVHVAHIVMVLVIVLLGTITVFGNIRKFFRQWETYFKILALSTAAFIVFSRESTIRNHYVETNIAAVSIFFTWVEFMMILGRTPRLGIYILMFTRVAKSIITFLLAFSPLLIAFTLCFRVLFSKMDIFTSVQSSFVKTLMMMIGEIEYQDIYRHVRSENQLLSTIISKIFLVLFLFLIPILMANLLIGLAVNDIPDLQYQGKIRRLVKEASYLESYEKVVLLLTKWVGLPNSVKKLFLGTGDTKREMTIYPNRTSKYLRKYRSAGLPPDVIKEAIICGTKKVSYEVVKEDLETIVHKFYNEYNCRQERLEKAISTLHDVVASQKTGGDEDVPDSPLKCGWKRKSPKKYYRR